jgi:hypothetical protein
LRLYSLTLSNGLLIQKNFLKAAFLRNIKWMMSYNALKQNCLNFT